MLNTQRFRGEINNKNIYYFLKQLDNSLNQIDRVELVRNILYTQENGRFVDEFFEEAFEQKDTKNGIDSTHIKMILNKSDNLSMDDVTCRGLERMADYILYAPDSERINKKTQYNFYPKDIFEKKILQKEKSIDELVDKNKDYSESNDEIIDFLIRKGENYKKEIKQRISSKDKSSNDIIMQYFIVEEALSKMLKADNNLKTMNVRDRKAIGKLIYDLRDDQVMCKDMMNGTIYFKQALSDSTEIDYDMFDYSDKKQILALLKLPPRNDFDDDLACMIYDLGNLMNKIKFTKDEKMVLNLWRSKDSTTDTIAKILDVTTPYINKILSNIAKKIAVQYWIEYEDWYYLNIVKGHYITCSRCGEVKLVSQFDKDSSKSAGYKSICKKCRSLGTK